MGNERAASLYFSEGVSAVPMGVLHNTFNRNQLQDGYDEIREIHDNSALDDLLPLFTNATGASTQEQIMLHVL